MCPRDADARRELDPLPHRNARRVPVLLVEDDPARRRIAEPGRVEWLFHRKVERRDVSPLRLRDGAVRRIIGISVDCAKHFVTSKHDLSTPSLLGAPKVGSEASLTVDGAHTPFTHVSPAGQVDVTCPATSIAGSRRKASSAGGGESRGAQRGWS